MDKVVATEELEEQQLRKMRGLSGRRNPSGYEIFDAFHEIEFSRTKFIPHSTINQATKHFWKKFRTRCLAIYFLGTELR